MERKNLFGTEVRLIEAALLKGYSDELDLRWHCFTGDIALFIVGSYELGFNPLPHLREIFPSFNWEFHEVDALSGKKWLPAIKALVDQADYFWPAGFENEECFVVARRKDSKEEPWRLLGREDMLASSIDSLEKVGLQTQHPLSPD